MSKLYVLYIAFALMTPIASQAKLHEECQAIKTQIKELCNGLKGKEKRTCKKEKGKRRKILKRILGPVKRNIEVLKVRLEELRSVKNMSKILIIL